MSVTAERSEEILLRLLPEMVCLSVDVLVHLLVVVDVGAVSDTKSIGETESLQSFEQLVQPCSLPLLDEAGLLLLLLLCLSSVHSQSPQSLHLCDQLRQQGGHFTGDINLTEEIHSLATPLEGPGVQLLK